MFSLKLQANDRYAAHQIVEARTRDSNAPVRWGHYDDGTIEIRSTRPLDGLGWDEMTVPANGTMIRFVVDSQVRSHRGLKPDGRQNRVVNLDYGRNMDWIERQAPQVGLELIAVDFDPISIRINRWNRTKSRGAILRHNLSEQPRYPFTMSASRFRGTARVVNAPLFEEVLASIPKANPKAFGLGFIIYKPVGER
jgi:hypothetical protein